MKYSVFLYHFIFSCPKPISVARHVLEHSSANLLVGSGATNYARQNGFQTEASAELLSDASREAYKVNN